VKKFYHLLFFFLFLIAGCGNDSLNSKKSANQQSNNLTDQWFSVVITVPPVGASGGAWMIWLNNKSYLIGSQTSPEIANYLYGLPFGGSFQKQIKGQISKEKGNFPNPTAEFDVIHVQGIR
jgi:hypothetical protein